MGVLQYADSSRDINSRECCSLVKCVKLYST